MEAIVRFYKISFLIGFHAAAAGWAFLAIKFAIEGRFGPALGFGIPSGITTLFLIGWWLNRALAIPND
jgi:hypothetical protein